MQVTGPREAVLKKRIHGGTKARENNVEEAVGVLGMLSPLAEGLSRNSQTP
jgi:hypothetical protein